MSKHRTAEWGRVSRSGFLSVTDEAGEIVVRSLPPIILPLRLALGLLSLAGALYCLPFGLLGDQGALAISGGAAAYAALMLWLYAQLYLGYAYAVRFRAEEIVFCNAIGMQIGFIERAAMQQIAVEAVPYQQSKDAPAKHLQMHVFYSDSGFISAMPQTNERHALMRNNVLISAFRQPVHLDGGLLHRAA